MKIFPAVHYSMGGLWVDYERTADGFIDLGSPKNHMSNIPGLYAIGEAEYQYHGANRLGANSLLSCVYAGQIGGPAAVLYAQNQAKAGTETPSSVYEAAEAKWTNRFAELARRDGPENPYKIHELGRTMLENVTIVRENKLEQTNAKIQELTERWKKERPRQRTVGERAAVVPQPAREHAAPLARGDAPERSRATRTAARTTSRFPRPRRREVAEDHGGRVHARRGRSSATTPWTCRCASPSRAKYD